MMLEKLHQELSLSGCLKPCSQPRSGGWAAQHTDPLPASGLVSLRLPWSQAPLPTVSSIASLDLLLYSTLSSSLSCSSALQLCLSGLQRGFKCLNCVLPGCAGSYCAGHGHLKTDILAVITLLSCSMDGRTAAVTAFSRSSPPASAGVLD